MASLMTQYGTSCFVSVSYSFVTKWTLKAKVFNDLHSKSTNYKRSDLYQSKTTKDLSFYLEMEAWKEENYDEDSFDDERFFYQIKVKSCKNWSFKLEYAFLVSKDMAYKIMNPYQLSFLTLFQRNYVKDEEDVTIHCVVNACPAYPAPSAEEDNLSLIEGQNIVNFEEIPNFTLASDYKNEAVIDFLLKGVIPYWTVGEAIKIISETEQHKCEVLKILCVEYLMDNIEKQNLKMILRAAIEYDLPRLERCCTSKIAYGSVVI